LEDKKGDMGSYRRRIRAVRDHSGDSSKLTIMAVRGVGKVRTCKISPRLLLWSALFFVLYLITSVFITNDYFYLRRDHREQVARLKKLEQRMVGTERSLYQAKQRLALLREYIQRLEQTPTVPEKTKDPGPRVKEEAPAENVFSLSEHAKTDATVEVKELRVEQEGSKLIVEFRLYNIRTDDQPVRGYVHMIAMDKRSAPPHVWTFPRVTLRQGVPVDFRRGQRFFINNFKSIHGEYYLARPGPAPSAMNILVYNDSGDLIFQKGFELKNES